MKTNIINPFIVSGYLSPDYFCDRKEETERLLSALRNGRNVLLTSPRRMGKTGLIFHTFYQLKRQRANTLYIDLFPTENLADFTKVFASSVLGQLDSDPVKLVKKASALIKGIRPILYIDEMTGQPKLSLDLVKGKEESTLEDVFTYLRESGKECYIAFDEFQQIANYPESTIESILRSHIQRLPKIHFVFSGSQAHMLSEMFLSPKRPFYQSTSSQVIGAIDEASYFSFAGAFLKEQGRDLPKDVFHKLYGQFEGHTWYIQKVLNQIYEMAGRPINEELVREAVRTIIDENAYYYQMLTRAYSKGQVKLMKAVAKEGKVKEITSGAFIARYDLKATSSIKTSLKKLLEDEVIYRSEDGYLIYDRFYGEWLFNAYN